MKKLFISLFLLFTVTLSFAQTTELSTPSGKNVVFTHAFKDSVGTDYSNVINLQGYLPQDIYTNYIPFYISGTGTADSVQAVVITRMILNNKPATYTAWVVSDTVNISFNKVDGIAYYYPINFNGGHPDQMEIKLIGASTVNRSDVVINVIAVLTKQLPTTVFQIR